MLTDEELILLKGGSISAAFLNSISRLVDTLLNLGQTVGSSLRRKFSNSVCKIS